MIEILTEISNGKKRFRCGKVFNRYYLKKLIGYYESIKQYPVVKLTELLTYIPKNEGLTLKQVEYLCAVHSAEFSVYENLVASLGIGEKIENICLPTPILDFCFSETNEIKLVIAQEINEACVEYFKHVSNPLNKEDF